MNDSELLGLQEKVFDLTEWGNTNLYLCYEWDVNGYRTGEKAIEHKSLIEMESAEKHIIQPYYNSDYLMDKLEEQHYQLRLEHNHADMTWYAYFAGKELHNLFDNDDDWSIAGNTPLKALLRLVIALAEAGELK